MVGMHGRGVVRVLGTVCVGASLLAGGWAPTAATASTAAMESGGPRASAPMFLRGSRNRPSPGYQFGLSEEEQDYIYGSRHIGTSHGTGPHGPRGPLAS
jgi:hypothetical protein